MSALIAISNSSDAFALTCHFGSMANIGNYINTS
jgi:hypothetical protein